jgi:hypothetical protein
MPGFNRTGPRGQGPCTGRGAGFCSPSYYVLTPEADPFDAYGRPRPRWGLRANLQGGMGRGRRNRRRRY